MQNGCHQNKIAHRFAKMGCIRQFEISHNRVNIQKVPQARERLNPRNRVFLDVKSIDLALGCNFLGQGNRLKPRPRAKFRHSARARNIQTLNQPRRIDKRGCSLGHTLILKYQTLNSKSQTMSKRQSETHQGWACHNVSKKCRWLSATSACLRLNVKCGSP